MEQHGSDEFDYEDDGFIIQDDGLLEVDSDEYDSVIEEELSKFHQQQADKYAQLQAISPWVAVPLASPDPVTQQLRVEEYHQQAHVQDESGLEQERSEYIPPPRPPALQQHLEGPFTATEHSPAVQHRPISAAAPSSGVSADAFKTVSASQDGLPAVASDARSGMLHDGDAEFAAHHLSSSSSECEADIEQHEHENAAPAWEASGLHAEDPAAREYEFITEMHDGSPSPAAIECNSESDTHLAAGVTAAAANFCEQQVSTELSDANAAFDRPAVNISEQQQAILQESPAAAAGDDALLQDGADSMDELPAAVDLAMADAGPTETQPEAHTSPAEHAATAHVAQSVEGFFLDNWQGGAAEDAVSHEAANQEQSEVYVAGSIKQQEAGELEAASGACAVPEVTAASDMQPRDVLASQHDEPAPSDAPQGAVQPPAEEPAGAGSAAAVGVAADTDPSSAAAAIVEQDTPRGEQREWDAASEGSAAGEAAIELQPSANSQPEVQLDAAVHDPNDSELLPAHLSVQESGLGGHLMEQDGQFSDPAVSADLQEQQLQHEAEAFKQQQVLHPQVEGLQHQQTQPDEGDQPAGDASLPVIEPQQAEWTQPEDLPQPLSEQQEQPYDGEEMSVSRSQQSATEGQAWGQGVAAEQQEVAYQQQAHGSDELLMQSDLEQELLPDVEQHQHQQAVDNVIPRASDLEQQMPVPHTDAGDGMVLPGQGHIGHVQQYLGGSQEVEQAGAWEQQQASAGELDTHAVAPPAAELGEPEQHVFVGSGATDALQQHEQQHQQHQQLGDEYGEQQGVGELPEQQYDAYRLSQQATLPTDTSAAVADLGDLNGERQSDFGRDHEAAAAVLITQTDTVLPSGQQYGDEQQDEGEQSAAYEYQQQAGEQQTEELIPVQQQQQQQQQEDEEAAHSAAAEHSGFAHHHEISTDVVGDAVHTGNSTDIPAASTAAPAALDAAELVPDTAAADADDGFIYQDEDPGSSNSSSRPDSPVETAAGVGVGIKALAVAAGIQYPTVASSADDGGHGEYTGNAAAAAAAADWYPAFNQQDAAREHIISWPDGVAISPSAAAAGAARSAARSPQPPPYAPHHGSRPVHGKTRPAVGSPSPDMMARYDGKLFTATAAPVVGRLRPESAPARRALSPTKRVTSPVTQIRGLALAEGHSKQAWVAGGACAPQQQLAQAVNVYDQQAAAWGITVSTGMHLPSRPHTSHGYTSSSRSPSIGRKAGWMQPAGVGARSGSHAWAAEPGNSSISSSSGKPLVRPVSADRASRAREGQLSARQQQQQWQDGPLQQQQRPASQAASTSRTNTPRQCYDEIHSLSQAYGFKPRNMDSGDGVCSSNNWQQQRGQNMAQPGTIPWDASPIPLNTPNSMPIAAATQSYDVLLAAKAGTGKSAGHSALCSTAAGHSALLARPRTAGSAEAGSIPREHPGFTPRVGRGSPTASSRGGSGSGSEVYLADLLQKIRQANNSCRKLDLRKVYRLGKGSSVTWQLQQIVVEAWGLTEDQEAQQHQMYNWQLKGCLTLQQFNKQCEKLAAKVLESEAAAAVAGAQEVLVVDSASGSSGSSPDWARPDTHAAAAAGPTVRQAWPAATEGASSPGHRSQTGVRPQSARPSSASRSSVRGVTGNMPNALPAWEGDYL